MHKLVIITYWIVFSQIKKESETVMKVSVSLCLVLTPSYSSSAK